MDFCRKMLPSLAATLLSALSFSSYAHDLSHQLELMLGVNHSYHNTEQIYVGRTTEQVDSLHETGNGNDAVGGAGYGYNILPWFVAYQNKDMSDSLLQHVWVGLDWIFMNTVETGDVYASQNPDFNDFRFRLTQDTMRLMINTEIDFISLWKSIHPFVQASVGAARIASSYDDDPVPGIFGGGLTVSEHVNYNLAYSLGAGFKVSVKPNLQIGASYLFTDFGYVKTSTHAGNVRLAKPIKDRLMTSSALLNINYLF